MFRTSVLSSVRWKNISIIHRCMITATTSSATNHGFGFGFARVKDGSIVDVRTPVVKNLKRLLREHRELRQLMFENEPPPNRQQRQHRQHKKKIRKMVDKFADTVTPELMESARLLDDEDIVKRFCEWYDEYTKKNVGLVPRPREERRHVSESDFWNASDCTHPQEWYPLARSMTRRIVAHVGPTNSGKTFHALKGLHSGDPENDEESVYCGPLRLLAWEVYEKMKREDIPCNLLTGQEAETMDGARITACTIEMSSTTTKYRYAVVDEYQMAGDPDRGSAWTRAILGLAADELHVCGDPTMLPLLRKMCSLTGDTLQVNTYERLSPLEFDDPINSLNRVQRGDCVVAFSRRTIYKLKSEIERRTNLRCCVIYGNLPPATRKQQAQLFNSPATGYDVLVASDAVGMGLNLNIRRIVFSSIEKFDGTQQRRLLPSEVRQIGGRAGRFRSQYPEGYLTTLNRGDLGILKALYKRTPPSLKSGGISPPVDVLEKFAELMLQIRSVGDGVRTRKIPFKDILDAFCNVATVTDDFFMCRVDDMKLVASIIESVHMPLQDRYVFSLAPIKDTTLCRTYLKKYAKAYAHGGEVRLGIRVADFVPTSAFDLERFEDVHSVLDLYVWLYRRFPSQFIEVVKAREALKEVQEMIELGLVALSSNRRLSYAQLYDEHQRLKKRTANT